MTLGRRASRRTARVRDSWMLATIRRNIGDTIRWNPEAMVSVGRHSSCLLMACQLVRGIFVPVAVWLVWATGADDETQASPRADYFGCRAPTTTISVEHRPSTGAMRARRPSPKTRPRSRLWLRCWSAWWPPSSNVLVPVGLDRERQKYDMGRAAVHLPGHRIEMPGRSARGRSRYRLLTWARESPRSAATAAPRGRSWSSSSPWGSSNPGRPSRCPLQMTETPHRPEPSPNAWIGTCVLLIPQPPSRGAAD